jgi:pimeloyl-ACP methyl ester carboxylesterase
MNHLVVVGGTAVPQFMAERAYSVFGKLIDCPTTITSIPAWGFDNSKQYGMVPSIIHLVPGLGHPEEAYEKIAQKIFDQAGENQIDIIGHSQGGFDAISLAYQYPDKVRNAITIATPHDGTQVAWLARKFAPTQAIKAMSPDSRFIQRHKLRLDELSKMNGGPSIHSIFTVEDGLVPYRSACLEILNFTSENFHDYIVCPEREYLNLRRRCEISSQVELLEDDWYRAGQRFGWAGQVFCHGVIIWQKSVLELTKSILGYQDGQPAEQLEAVMQI